MKPKIRSKMKGYIYWMEEGEREAFKGFEFLVPQDINDFIAPKLKSKAPCPM